ncbi:MAG TPA: hypothetical protein VJZ93_00130 [Candidatus Nanoarchaeia archaeon]|nr:hypothetical protein [Candidatus Nanoarchaeia archaeon]
MEDIKKRLEEIQEEMVTVMYINGGFTIKGNLSYGKEDPNVFRVLSEEGYKEIRTGHIRFISKNKINSNTRVIFVRENPLLLQRNGKN